MSEDEPSLTKLDPECFRELFAHMDEGFCVIEFIDGPNGPLDYYVHIEAN